MRVFATWLVLLVAACASHAPAAPPSSIQGAPDPESITRLEGYRSHQIAEAVFGGLARWLEVGPTDAQPLLLVHGIGDGGARDFFPLLPLLAAKYHVYAVDLPGFGLSTRGTTLYSPERYVQFLHAAIRPRINGTFALLGHSMGATISLLYAYRHAEDLTRLVLVDAAGILHREALVPFVAQTGIGKLFEPAGGIAGAFTSLIVSRATGPEALLENDFARAHVFSDPEQIAAAALIMHDFGPAIAESRVPALVVWGRHDGIAPLRTGKLLAARLPRARLEILERSAHVPMETEPEALAERVTAWLSAPLSPDREQTPTLSRQGRCEQKQDLQFEGDYDSIEIVGCQRVRISQVRARSVRIWASEVALEATSIEGGDQAIFAKRSRLELTGCVLSGQEALALDSSELDVAGTEIQGSTAAVRTDGPSRILFSASAITVARQRRYWHGPVDLAQGQEL